MFFNKQWILKAKSLKLENEVVYLKHNRFYQDTYNGAQIKNYSYQIYLKKSNKLVGYCDLRDGDSDALYYLGNIGYNIFNHFQGHGYAYYATLCLIDLAREIGMDTLNITCNTDNIASIKTIERSGFKEIASVAVPVDEPLFHQGDYYKFIYTLNLKEKS